MASRLHVGNLPYNTTEDDLRQLFGQVGTVVAVSLPSDRATGRPRGFGFVEMATDSEAEQAIQKYNGYMMDNRPLRVEMAKEREQRSGGYGERSGGYGDRSGGYGGGYGASGNRSDYGDRGRRERGRQDNPHGNWAD